MTEPYVEEIGEKFKRCKKCGRPHQIRAYLFLSKEEKARLKDFPCHLKFLNYKGSFIEGNKTIDVFDTLRNFEEKIIYEEKEEEEEAYYCEVCGKEISKKEYEENDGMCSMCAYGEFTDLDDDL